MEFFDKKEEVLEIKLTPFGRYKLSKGQFKPTHYAFFDEGILYNTEYATSTGYTENQNVADERIRNQTPTLKTLNVYEGIQTTQVAYATAIRKSFKDNPSLPEDPLFMKPGDVYNRAELQKAPSKIDFLAKPLGTSRQNSDKYPAWAVGMLQGQISASATTYSSSVGIEAIPQLDITVKYNTYAAEIPGYAEVVAELGGVLDGVDPLEYLPGVNIKGDFNEILTEIFPDGTYLGVKKNDLVIEIGEDHSAYEKRNLDIEVFLSSSDLPSGMQQLYFNDNPTQQTEDDVGYYLVLHADGDIDTELIKRYSIRDINALGSATVANSVSTREYFVKDIYESEEDICD